MLLVRADSRMPRTRTTVRSITIRNAGMLKPKCQPGLVQVLAGQVLQAGGQIGGRNPLERDGSRTTRADRLDVRGEADADAHVGEGVFEDQVPADDPRDQLAQRGVGVGVRRAGDGNHRGEFGVAEPGEHAHDRDQDQRERERRAGAGAARHGGVRQQVMNQTACC